MPRDHVCRVLSIEHQNQRVSVDTMSHAGRLVRGIWENMAKVTVATAAAHFGADSSPTGVFVFGDRARLDSLKKRWPTTAGVKLVFGAVKTLATASTMVAATSFFIEISPSVGRFGARLAQYLVLLGTQHIFPVGIAHISG